MPITTEVVSLNPAYGEVYLIQHYVMKKLSLNQNFLPVILVDFVYFSPENDNQLNEIHQ
jgi:hypothetical protein